MLRAVLCWPMENQTNQMSLSSIEKSSASVDTAKGPRSRGWCFTYNNPVDGVNPLEWTSVYVVYQKERGAEGTEHLQGYIYFKNAVSLTHVRKLCKCHWMQAKGSAQQNRVYCTKEETRIAGPFEQGEMPLQGKRSDIEELKTALTEGYDMLRISEEYTQYFLRYRSNIEQYMLLHTKPRSWPMEVIVYWGSTGAGKSRCAFEEYPDAYVKSKSNGNNNWWNGYLKQEVVIVDEYYGWFPWDFMLRICDRYPLSVETKGGSVQFVGKKIIFTSNKHPKEWYPNMHDRYGWDPTTNPLCRRITLCQRFYRLDEEKPKEGDVVEEEPCSYPVLVEEPSSTKRVRTKRKEIPHINLASLYREDSD